MLLRSLVLGAVGLFVGCYPTGGPVLEIDLDASVAVVDMSSVSDSGAQVDARSDSGAAGATPVTIANPSFELPATGSGMFVTSAPPIGWSAYGTINNGNRSVGVLNPQTTTLYLDAVPQGNNVAVVFLMDRPAEQTYYANIESGLQQTLTATLLADSEYTLSVQVGNINVDSSPNHAYAFTGFPNYRVELLAAGQVLASDNNTLKPGEGRFLLSTVKFTTASQHALLGQALGIRLVNLNSNVGIEVNFDDVKLERVAK